MSNQPTIKHKLKPIEIKNTQPTSRNSRSRIKAIGSLGLLLLPATAFLGGRYNGIFTPGNFEGYKPAGTPQNTNLALRRLTTYRSLSTVVDAELTTPQFMEAFNGYNKYDNVVVTVVPTRYGARVEFAPDCTADTVKFSSIFFDANQSSAALQILFNETKSAISDFQGFNRELENLPPNSFFCGSDTAIDVLNSFIAVQHNTELVGPGIGYNVHENAQTSPRPDSFDGSHVYYCREVEDGITSSKIAVSFNTTSTDDSGNPVVVEATYKLDGATGYWHKIQTSRSDDGDMDEFRVHDDLAEEIRPQLETNVLNFPTYEQFNNLITQPTGLPTGLPTVQQNPTSQPTVQPTFLPTLLVTDNPTLVVTDSTGQPTGQPTVQQNPTSQPTVQPTFLPTLAGKPLGYVELGSHTMGLVLQKGKEDDIFDKLIQICTNSTETIGECTDNDKLEQCVVKAFEDFRTNNYGISDDNVVRNCVEKAAEEVGISESEAVFNLIESFVWMTNTAEMVGTTVLNAIGIVTLFYDFIKQVNHCRQLNGDKDIEANLKELKIETLDCDNKLKEKFKHRLMAAKKVLTDVWSHNGTSYTRKNVAKEMKKNIKALYLDMFLQDKSEVTLSDADFQSRENAINELVDSWATTKKTRLCKPSQSYLTQTLLEENMRKKQDTYAKIYQQYHHIENGEAGEAGEAEATRNFNIYDKKNYEKLLKELKNDNPLIDPVLRQLYKHLADFDNDQDRTFIEFWMTTDTVQGLEIKVEKEFESIIESRKDIIYIQTTDHLPHYSQDSEGFLNDKEVIKVEFPSCLTVESTTESNVEFKNNTSLPLKNKGTGENGRSEKFAQKNLFDVLKDQSLLEELQIPPQGCPIQFTKGGSSYTLHVEQNQSFFGSKKNYVVTLDGRAFNTEEEVLKKHFVENVGNKDGNYSLVARVADMLESEQCINGKMESYLKSKKTSTFDDAKELVENGILDKDGKLYFLRKHSTGQSNFTLSYMEPTAPKGNKTLLKFKTKVEGGDKESTNLVKNFNGPENVLIVEPKSAADRAEGGDQGESELDVEAQSNKPETVLIKRHGLWFELGENRNHRYVGNQATVKQQFSGCSYSVINVESNEVAKCCSGTHDLYNVLKWTAYANAAYAVAANSDLFIGWLKSMGADIPPLGMFSSVISLPDALSVAFGELMLSGGSYALSKVLLKTMGRKRPEIGLGQLVPDERLTKINNWVQTGTSIDPSSESSEDQPSSFKTLIEFLSQEFDNTQDKKNTSIKSFDKEIGRILSGFNVEIEGEAQVNVRKTPKCSSAYCFNILSENDSENNGKSRFSSKDIKKVRNMGTSSESEFWAPLKEAKIFGKSVLKRYDISMASFASWITDEMLKSCASWITDEMPKSYPDKSSKKAKAATFIHLVCKKVGSLINEKSQQNNPLIAAGANKAKLETFKSHLRQNKLLEKCPLNPDMTVLEFLLHLIAENLDLTGSKSPRSGNSQGAMSDKSNWVIKKNANDTFNVTAYSENSKKVFEKNINLDDIKKDKNGLYIEHSDKKYYLNKGFWINGGSLVTLNNVSSEPRGDKVQVMEDNTRFEELKSEAGQRSTIEHDLQETDDGRGEEESKTHTPKEMETNEDASPPPQKKKNIESNFRQQILGVEGSKSEDDNENVLSDEDDDDDDDTFRIKNDPAVISEEQFKRLNNSNNL